jgi:acyl-coenzyme A thioesterase PaaI-like protein
MEIDYTDTYQGCFVCGTENAKGMRLRFDCDEKGEVRTEWTPKPYMQGFENIVHGGFIAMVLDEVMAKVCLYRGTPAVTVRMEVRFKKPVFVGESLLLGGRCVEARKKSLRIEAYCLGEDNETKAEAHGLFFPASREPSGAQERGPCGQKTAL